MHENPLTRLHLAIHKNLHFQGEPNVRTLGRRRLVHADVGSITTLKIATIAVLAVLSVLEDSDVLHAEARLQFFAARQVMFRSRLAAHL